MRDSTKGGFDVPKKRLLDCMAEASMRLMLLVLTLIAIVLNLLLEILGRHSISEGFIYLFTHPILFLYNSLIILFTLSLCLIVKKRLILLLIISGVWLGLGVANFILLISRSSPLSAIDFLIAPDALGLVTIYLSAIQIIGIVLFILAFIALIVFLYIRCPKSRIIYHKSIAVVAVIGIAVFSATVFATETHAIDIDDGELADIYDNYGFAYCFTRSLMSHGVEKPEDYDHEALGELLESLAPDDTDETDIPADSETAPPDSEADVSGEPSEPEEILPNIIYIQLESFMDVNYLKGLEFSENPIPTFTKLKAEGVSGLLSVKNVGGGTANTEFEILTGMNLDHFGFGEYPYTTILKSRACESIAYNLKRLGYGTHALHNHTATFYDRNVAYANLGFDSFTPVEMMTDVRYNQLGWECDDVLTGEILSALDSTDGPDYVFGVTVQGHGKYPSEPLDEDELVMSGYNLKNAFEDDIVKVYGISDPQLLSEYTYYVNQLRETDEFISDLLDALTERGEPCVVVLYGDHLPALALDEDDLSEGNLYQTEYVIWTNTELVGLDSDIAAADSENIADSQNPAESENTPSTGDDNTDADNNVAADSETDMYTGVNQYDLDLEAYMLSAYVQLLCGFSEGDITRLHQSELESGTSMDEELRMLEYAQLYDDFEQPVFETTDMVFGTRPVIVNDWNLSGNTLYITGEGFNKYSRVKLGVLFKPTVYVDEHTLKVENIYFYDGTPEVVQCADDGTELATAVFIPETE